MTEPLPIGCAARHDEVRRRSFELLESFVNGNRSWVSDSLRTMEAPAALAVVAWMMTRADNDTRNSLTRYFMEVA